MKIILRSRQANPAPQTMPRSPGYNALGYSPAVPYAGAAPAGMPYAEPTYPNYPPPDMPLGPNSVQPPPPSYPNPNYGYAQGGASPGHTGQPPMQQGGYQQPPSGYQQGYEAVDPQQYSAGYEMGQPQYSGEQVPLFAESVCATQVKTDSTCMLIDNTCLSSQQSSAYASATTTNHRGSQAPVANTDKPV